ncbi:MAG: glycoside hydrolase family 2 [Ignavibacteriales bacterium]|nr:glycoside hydrolase family 2 [Ignavibacteriales bacterium]
MIKKTFYFIATLLYLYSNIFSQETQLFYLSGKDADSPINWEFMVSKGRNSNSWSTIPVPSNWELQGFGEFNYGHDKNKSDEIGFYKYNFYTKKSWEHSKIFIVFEGVMTDTEVKLNGKICGPIHQGGFYRFEYDVTNLIKFDDKNLLEVKVKKVSENESIEIAERKSDYWVFGGIFRPVYLKILPKEFIERTAINATHDGKFNIDVFLSKISSAKNVRVQVVNIKGEKVGKAFEKEIYNSENMVTLSSIIENPKTWTAETPNLYYADITLSKDKQIIHTVRERFGFRTIEVREGKGIYLNDKIITLKGCDRHSFWPTTGRAISRNKCYDDIMLLKEMNMNAVRMSHYPPDAYFLDLCDEYGIYVLDEVAGWQKPSYDTPTSKRLIKSTVTRDVNHPSILFWDNGNEGGWNYETDDEFSKYDPQKRRVLHPWELFGGIDTDHYESYESVQQKMKSGNIFMPTEHLHGLYDGGLGAGLNDFWKLMWGNPLNGGMFLWVFADEGVVRNDKNGFIDTDGNHAPDGILGPFHEKEASFYTIKEIWSPIYIETEKVDQTKNFNEIEIENRYDFTNLKECKFKWQLVNYADKKFHSSKNEILASGFVKGPNIEPRSNGKLNLNLSNNYENADAIFLTAYDYNNTEIYTWKWKIISNKKIVDEFIQASKTAPELIEEKSEYEVITENFKFKISKHNGQLVSVKNLDKEFSFNNGPQFVADITKEKKSNNYLQIKNYVSKNNQVIEVKNHTNFDQLKWTIYNSGWLQLDYSYTLNDSVNYVGVSFDYPENKMLSMKWLGKGPYRVWKNRLKGQTIDVWENNYKNFAPNTNWDYPEFVGYFADFSWIKFDTEEGKISVLTEDENLFFRVYSQKDGEEPRHTKMIWPEGDISFLHAIPPIGTKFHKAADLGPSGHNTKMEGTYSATLYFYFGELN